MSDPLEIEVKLRVRSAGEARVVLREMGAVIVRDRHLEDNLLLDAADERLRGADKALRLRTTPHGARLTYKGPRIVAEGAKCREEVECEVAAPEALRRALELSGLHVFFRYQKQREEWRWRDVAIALDETPIGTFVEIEGDLIGIHEAARAMGRSPDDYIHASYPALFREVSATGDMVFSA